MFKTKIKVESINLNKIIFTVTPEIYNLEKSQLKVLLNNEIFTEYDLILKEINGSIYYQIQSCNKFDIYDILDLQIIEIGYVSNMAKIIFCKFFDEGKAYIDFKLDGKYEGKYVFTLKDQQVCEIKSPPLVVTKPINPENSYIYTDDYNYKLGDIIEVNIKLNTVSGSSVPDGLYEIEILDYY